MDLRKDLIQKIVDAIIDAETFLTEARNAYEAERIRRIQEQKYRREL